MILTDREILAALDSGQIDVSPRPEPERLSSTALDLTLGTSLLEWQCAEPAGVDMIFNPGRPGAKATEIIKKHTTQRVIGSEGFILSPRSFVLAWTAESVNLRFQSRIAARVEGKSSLARMGVAIHVTAPTIHSGFEGKIQLEIANLGPLRVCLTPGMAICQLIFELTLGTPTAGYRGQFYKQQAG